MKKTVLICFLVSTFCLLPHPLFAEIVIEPGFTGTVAITFPNGEIILIEPGEPIPDIPTDSIVEVFNGEIVVSTDQGDEVGVQCLGQQASAQGASSVSLNCTQDGGVLNVVKGNVQMVDETGKTSTVSEGSSFNIQPEQTEEAAPTAAAEPTGAPDAGDDLGDESPVDSRSIESSPSL